MQFITEPLYPAIEPLDWEKQLFHSKAVRRLKQLAHFGAGAFVSPVVHSRYEHTVGVWKLVAHFFPDDLLLRAAAILHDIGHLPFSHAVEKSLGFNHHLLTEQYIQEAEIKAILQNAGIAWETVIDLLNRPSPLTGVDDILGIDHLDSFLRDTYMAGGVECLPKELLPKLRCSKTGIEVIDEQAGLYLLSLIVKDHQLFLQPFMVAGDRLLVEAIKDHWEHEPMEHQHFARLTDGEVLALLFHSKGKKARELTHALIYEPTQINLVGASEVGFPISIRKIYGKTPLYKGERFTLHNNTAKKMLESLSTLNYEGKVRIKRV